MKRTITTQFLLSILLTSLFITGCSTEPSENAINTAIAQTQAAQTTLTQSVAAFTATPEPSSTPTGTSTTEPTNTFTPIPTNTTLPTHTPTLTIEERRLQFTQIMATAILELVADVESVSMARIENDRFEVELQTRWASRDRQPAVSYDVIRLIAGLMANVPADELTILMDDSLFSVYLVTYSTDGEYRFMSTTDYDTLKRINDLAISYEEWLDLSNAGFR